MEIKVLMIEDNPSNAMLVRRVLEKDSFEVHHAWVIGAVDDDDRIVISCIDDER